jgi:PAS fold
MEEQAMKSQRKPSSTAEAPTQSEIVPELEQAISLRATPLKPSEMHYQTILNAIPIPAFVVDEDVAILDLNRSATHFCGQDREAVYRLRGGDVLRCLHANDVPEGCGRGPLCKNCVIRNSVRKCLETQAVSRKVMNLQILHEQATKEIQVLITASPMLSGGENLALVMVEDITDRQKPVYNISPATPLNNIPKVEREIHWHSRSRPLREFPEDTQVRLRQLDFNRTITLCVGDEALYIKRVGLDKFLWCEA